MSLTTLVDDRSIVTKRTYTHTASGTTFAALTLDDFGGDLQDFSIVFGTPAPNSLTYTLTDSDGCTITSGTLTASSARLNLQSVCPLIGGVKLTISGNTTSNAVIILNFYLV